MSYGLGREQSGRKKHLSLILLTIFRVVWEERNRRAFKRVMEEVNRIRESWYHNLGCLVTGNLFSAIEDFDNLVEFGCVNIFCVRVGTSWCP